MRDDTSAIVVSAGNSTRMGGVDKQYIPLGGSNVLGMSLSALQRCESIKEVVVVARLGDAPRVEALAESLGVTKLRCVVPGGSTRQESVANGLREVSDGTTLVTIHDGARPLVRPEDVERCIQDARTYGGATLGVPVKDTIKVVEGGTVVGTPDRASLYATQTPQTFQKEAYYRGVEYAKAHHLDFTDDCQLVEAIGVRVHMTVGDYSNVKITTPEDVQVAESLLRERSGAECLE